MRATGARRHRPCAVRLGAFGACVMVAALAEAQPEPGADAGTPTTVATPALSAAPPAATPPAFSAPAPVGLPGRAEAGAADAGRRPAVDADGGVLGDGAADAPGGDAAALDAGDAGARDASDAAEPAPPIVLAPEPPPPTDPVEATDIVIRTIVGLALIVLLAYLAGLPRVRRLEERLRIAQLITAGFPFIALGVAARGLDVFTPPTIVKMTPLLEFGLGWVGFLVGFRFDVRFLDRVPEGTGLAVWLATAIPFVSIAAFCGAAMLAFSSSGLDAAIVRDALALGVAGAMTAPRVGRTTARTDDEHPADDLPRRIGELDEIAGVAGLALLASYFRPEDARLTWELTGTAWLFVTLGMGVAIGLVLYAAMSLHVTPTEFIAVALGSVAFAAGMAGFVHLSPVAVCFIAGALATNLPFRQKPALARILSLLERPIWLLFLVLVGALWDPSDWRGWVLVPVFVLARLVGKGVAVLSLRAATSKELPIDREHRIVFSRLSVVSIAIVISVQSLYQDDAVPWIVTAVIGGAIVSEVLVQLRYSAGERREAEG